MEKAYLFLQKLIALAINTLIFFALEKYIPFYFSIPVLLIILGKIISHMTEEIPKELYNFSRSEKFFTKGGLRDLIRIPVVFFAFIHNLVVWVFWGIYQIFVIVIEVIQFLKQLIFYLAYGTIWFFKLFVPFWKIVYYLFLHYIIKWPWWIYKYSFQAVKNSFNWNILKISFIGSFIALLLIHLFYFLEITLSIDQLVFVGIILSILPITWAFAEIASIRGQNLLYVPYREVRLKLRNGLESVRGLLFFITLFVVLLLIQTGLNLLGWLPQNGIVFLGVSLNISFLINIILIVLALIIVFSIFILPTYRLYNEFNETSFKSIYSLLKQIIKRVFQYIVGFIPASFFAAITIIPASIIIGLAFFITFQVKQNIVQVKIEKLESEQSLASDLVTEYKIGKDINRLKQVALFPKQFFQDIQHRSLLQKEINHYKKNKTELKLEFANQQSRYNQTTNDLSQKIDDENNKEVINLTRLETLSQEKALTTKRYNEYEKNINNEIALLDIDIEYAQLKYRQQPLVFYLCGFILVVSSSFISTFLLAYFGNFFYKAFLFKNDTTPAEWKTFISNEHYFNKNQPLLSTSLNILFILTIIYVTTRFVFKLY